MSDLPKLIVAASLGAFMSVMFAQYRDEALRSEAASQHPIFAWVFE